MINVILAVIYLDKYFNTRLLLCSYYKTVYTIKMLFISM